MVRPRVSEELKREKRIATARKWRAENPDKVKKLAKQSYCKAKSVDPMRKLFHAAKIRAREKGIPFTITLLDIPLPETCPILGIPIETINPIPGRKHPNSPSLDQIRPGEGYTPTNTMVISWRANELKSNGTLDEFERLVAFLRSGTPRWN